MTFALFLSITILFSLVMGALFLSYVIAIIIPFVRRKPGAAGDAQAFTWHFMIPCRDEEAVIGETIAYLEGHFPDAEVWVIDDDSEDRTADIVTASAERNPHIHLIQRRRPEARQGKAHALNYAWLKIRGLVGEVDLHHTVLVVVDADGRPSANMLEVCAGEDLFGSDDVAAVQVEVRMSNRDVRTPFPGDDWLKNLVARTFVRMQDIEFRGPISAIQLSRRVSRTVNVGGNGQLARWSALEEISTKEGPWRGALLEDFELGLHLLLGGWRNAYTPDAWVDQEALYSLPRYLTQRARWAQGTMQCFRYLPKIWSSRSLSNLGALEVTYFLLQPWLQLIGTIVYPWPLILMAYNAAVYPDRFSAYMQAGGAILLICYALIGIGEFAIWGFLYRQKSEPSATVLTATGWGFSYMLYVYLIYAVAWKAFYQVVRGQRGWAKTIRNAEQTTPGQLVARLK
jgi:1,2-diacylglycerol 3-beta-glucosyltransferase